MHRLPAGILAAALSLWSAAAAAAPFYVESPGVETREKAQAMMVAATTAHPGMGQARILRRYVRGAGWRYLVHVDDVGREKDARVLAGVFGSGAVVIDLESGAAIVGSTEGPVPPPPPPSPTMDEDEGAAAGGLFRRRDRADEDAPVIIAPPPAPAAAPAPPPPPAPPTPADRQREAEGLLRAAARAHGGAAGGLARVSQTPQLTFAYTRRVPDATGEGTLVAHHTYRRSAVGGMRLDVDVKKGGGVDSTTVVRPEGEAWVVVNGTPTTRDSQRAAEVVQRFGPEELLRVPLGLPQDLEERGAWRGLQVVGPEDDMLVLAPIDAAPGRVGLVDAAVFRDDHHLARVTWRRGSDTITYRFSGYFLADDGVAVPKKVRIEADGELVEEIQIDTLDAKKPVPVELFRK